MPCNSFLIFHILDYFGAKIQIKFQIQFKFRHFFNNKCGSWPILDVAVGYSTNITETCDEEDKPSLRSMSNQINATFSSGLNHDSSEGRKLCESYQNLDEGRFLPAINYILPYRGRLVSPALAFSTIDYCRPQPSSILHHFSRPRVSF